MFANIIRPVVSQHRLGEEEARAWEGFPKKVPNILNNRKIFFRIFLSEYGSLWALPIWETKGVLWRRIPNPFRFFFILIMHLIVVNCPDESQSIMV